MRSILGQTYFTHCYEFLTFYILQELYNYFGYHITVHIYRVLCDIPKHLDSMY